MNKKESKNVNNEKDETKLSVKIFAVSICFIFFTCIILAFVLGSKFGLKYMLICLCSGMGVILISAICAVVISKICSSDWYIRRNAVVNSVAIVEECHELEEGSKYNYACLLKVPSSGIKTCGLCKNHYVAGDPVRIRGILYGKKSKLVLIIKKEENK